MAACNVVVGIFAMLLVFGRIGKSTSIYILKYSYTDSSTSASACSTQTKCSQHFNTKRPNSPLFAYSWTASFNLLKVLQMSYHKQVRTLLDNFFYKFRMCIYIRFNLGSTYFSHHAAQIKRWKAAD